MNRTINPPELVKPVGYSHAVEVTGGRTIYLAGQIAFDEHGTLVGSDDIVKQFDQTLHNLQTAIRGARAELTDIVKLLIFVKNKKDYQAHLKEIGRVYRNYFGKHFPAMSLVEVSDLFEEGALIEIEGVAVAN